MIKEKVKKPTNKKLKNFQRSAMAMIAVNLVLEKIASLMTEEVQLLGGVRRGIDGLRGDLESMKSFLQDAEARSATDQGVRIWVKQVRDVAYDTEDVLEEFSVHLTSSNARGFFKFLSKSYHFIVQLKKHHQLAGQIQHIKEDIQEIERRRNVFSFKSMDGAASSSTPGTWHDPRMASLFLDEADVVGIENPRNLLISWLVEGEMNLTALSVVGMGGLGKTTLVNKTYDSVAVKIHFDCHAWITVSQLFTAAELLKAALKDFLDEAKEPVPEGIDTMVDLQLINNLRNYLQKKRYVVVFDDIWSINAWEAVKFAFPDCNCGSRIVFTTRVGDIATSVGTTCHVYHLKPLAEREAWTLFCMKAFRGEQNNICPEELEEMSRSILKKCGGLPLAIVAIGGLLSKKNKLALEWKKINDSLAAAMKGNSSLGSLERILLLSYNDLPYNLKYCYLYLCGFPEDYLIKRMKAVRLWVVERFVEEKPGFTMEEVAEDYLNELVSRSMIQVVHMDPMNRVRTFQIHDLMREIIQSKSKDEAFLMIQGGSNITSEGKVRRLSIHDNCEAFPLGKEFPHLRSLLTFMLVRSSNLLEGASFRGFSVLRVLELENAPISQFPQGLVGLVHLRYLSLRRTLIEELPESIGKLKNLEILDLKHSLVSYLPNGILQLERLYQLRNYRYRFETSDIFPKTYGMSVPARLGTLTNLQKLGSVEVGDNREVVQELGKLTQLKRLGIISLRKEYETSLCYSIEKLKQLTGLYMESTTEQLQLGHLSAPPAFLQRLYLKCSLQTLPKWVLCLQYLAKFVLQYSDLNDDPLNALQELPSLVVLELREAYIGEELCCGAKGFPRLKRLLLYQLKQVKCIRIAEGAMPGLKELVIASCENLETVPLGIEHLRNLQDLLMRFMPHKFLMKIKQPDGEDLWKVQHISTRKVVH